jgi:hypothetical protein
MKYPNSIVDDGGNWGVILQGHNLPLHVVQNAAYDILGPDCGTLNITEQHLAWKPRVKWCRNYDGSGCDLEGDWHSHWFALRPSHSRALQFTVAYPRRGE